MSWLPSGLTNLPGQITNFTKEVLSEGRDEIDDHATELRVTKSHNKELELTCSTLKSELDRMKSIIDEFTIKLQAQELQIHSQANEYRIAVETKEKEMKLLKLQNADLCERFSTSSFSVGNEVARIPPNEAKVKPNSRAFDENVDDFHDIISAQHEINQLRNEVKYLTAELGRLTHRSSDIQINDEKSSSTDGESLVQQLQARIADLQRQLTFEVDHHQHELSSLQAAHRQTTSALKKNHQTAIDQLQLQKAMADQTEASTADDVNARLVDLEQLNQKLMLDLEKLLEEKKAGQTKLDTLHDEILASNEHSEFMSSTPVAPSRARFHSSHLGHVDDSADLRELSASNQFLDDQVKTLQDQIVKQEQELEQFELVKSDWQIEKQALEGALKKLRQEPREKEQEPSIMQAREEQLTLELERERQTVKSLNMELDAVIDSTNHRNEELKEELLKKTSDLAAIEDLLGSKELQISELKSMLDQAASQNKASGDGESGPGDVERLEELEIQVDDLKQEVKKLESERGVLQEDKRREVEMLLAEKRSLEESLDELDVGHQEAVNQIVRSRAEVTRANETLKRQIVELEQRFTEKEQLMDKKTQEHENELSKYVQEDTALRTRTGKLETENVKIKEELSRNLDFLNEMQLRTVQSEQTAISRAAEITKLEGESKRLRQENEELLIMLKRVEMESDFPSADKDHAEKLHGELELPTLNVASLTKDLNDVKRNLIIKESEVKRLTGELITHKSRNPSNYDDRTTETNESLAMRINERRMRKALYTHLSKNIFAMCSCRFASSLFVRLYVPALSVALIGGLYPDLVSAKPPCPTGQFRNATSVPARCSPCSTCPINHIVRKPCNRQNDTVCGPFYEFEFFNQRQPRNGTLLGEPPHFSKLGYRLTQNGYVQPDGDSVALSTTSNTPDEAITVRCGQPQWRMLCYGLVAVLVVAVSVALTVFALFTYCRSSVKTIRLEETSGVTRASGVDDDSSVSSSTIIVNRDVRHLEEQLIHNQRRKAFLRWLFGSSAAADRLFSSNDYLDERHRRRFILMLDGSGESRGEVLPLEPYPGMTLTGRTDHHRHPTQPDPDEEMTPPDDEGGVVRQLDSQTTRGGVDESLTEEQSSVTVGERSLLLPQESRLQIEIN